MISTNFILTNLVAAFICTNITGICVTNSAYPKLVELPRNWSGEIRIGTNEFVVRRRYTTNVVEHVSLEPKEEE